MNLNNNSSYMAIMPSPVTAAVLAKSPVVLALPPQIEDSTINSEKQHQHQHKQEQQSSVKYLTSVKSSPQSPLSSSPRSPQPSLLLHQTSSTVPSVAAASSLSISSATTLSSAGGYHSNLISRISSNMNSNSNNSTIKDKVQITCNLSQDMDATGSKNNNNLSNENSVNLNLTHNNNSSINNNNNLNLIENNTPMRTHGSSSSIMNDATSSSLQMSSLLDDNCCPSKMGSSSPLNFLRFPSIGYGTEVNNALGNSLGSENALNLTNIGKNSQMTVTTTPLISSGIVQSRMTAVTGMSTSLRNDEGSDLMRRGNFGRN